MSGQLRSNFSIKTFPRNPVPPIKQNNKVIYIHTHTHTHIYINIYKFHIYIYIYIHIYTYESKLRKLFFTKVINYSYSFFVLKK